jgi:hypothetical protein
MNETEASDSSERSHHSRVIPPVTIEIPMPKGVVPPLEVSYGQSLDRYEEALSAMLMNRFEAAIPLLQQVAAGPNRELAERARIHLSTCNSRVRHLQAAPPSTSEGE